ncbi:MAG: SET domain-containing protein [Gammaproteobacteria bacterium]|nr:SET domain-containing protein [Gammaproteobacteria bacterium]
MLLVPTLLVPSVRHGLGLFARAPIARGTPIWRFTPHFDLDLPVALLDAQPALAQQALRHYGYIDARLGRFILCADDYRFVNHDATPNIESDFTVDEHGVDRAARDIAAGEELTVDYLSVEGARPA